MRVRAAACPARTAHLVGWLQLWSKSELELALTAYCQLVALSRQCVPARAAARDDGGLPR